MAKRTGGVSPRQDVQFAHLLTAEHRIRLLGWLSTRTPLLTEKNAPVAVRHLARDILHKTRGVVVSSTMALSTAIVAMRESGDFGKDSLEVSLLQAVLRYSEQYQVPPAAVMQLMAEDDPSLLRKAD